MIWAIEAQEGDDRLSCSECDERLQRKRGCRKPGSMVPYRERSVVYRSSSPHLIAAGADKLFECPVGLLLREAPWVYDAIAASVYAESAGLSVLQHSAWLQAAIRLISSERARHTEGKKRRQQNRSDAEYGKRRLKGA